MLPSLKALTKTLMNPVIPLYCSFNTESILDLSSLYVELVASFSSGVYCLSNLINISTSNPVAEAVVEAGGVVTVVDAVVVKLVAEGVLVAVVLVVVVVMVMVVVMLGTVVVVALALVLVVVVRAGVEVTSDVELTVVFWLVT